MSRSEPSGGRRSRVLLVSSNTVQVPYPVPPLGLCMMAERLSRDFDVELYDGAFDEGAGVGRAVERFAPDYIGVGIRNVDDMVMQQTAEYVDIIEQRFIAPIRARSDAPLILGGAGYSLFPELLLARLAADYGVVGEGERALPALLAALRRGAPPEGIPGVVTARSSDAAQAPTPVLLPPEFPVSHIDRWLDFEPYRERGSYPIQTKRGCTHRCVYCTYPTLEGTRYRPRSAESIADEIEQAAGRLGDDITFEFVDSVFNDPKGHAEGICREIIRRGLGVRLRTMGVNPRHADTELFELMRGAGFAQMDCTPDSAAPAVIDGMGKSFSRDDLERCALAIRQSGMPTMWFFLFGGPGETPDTVDETLDFVDRFVSEEDMVYVSAGLRIYPATRLHQLALRQGQVEATDDLLTPRFYVSPELAGEDLRVSLQVASKFRPNVVPAWESRPPPAIMRRAMQYRQETGTDEPMFRSLLRARRDMLGFGRGQTDRGHTR